MKYELRRLGEAVQYATAIAPYGFSCCYYFFRVLPWQVNFLCISASKMFITYESIRVIMVKTIND
jgi:hypothetical protein